MGVHALLLIGLPHLRLASQARIDAGTFTTRRIVPLAAPSAPAPEVQPAPAPAPPKPEVAPVKPKPVARPHKPSAPAKPTPSPVADKASAEPPGPVASTEPSLLNERPTGTGQFGGGALPQPIAPPVTDDGAGAAALALAQTLGDDVPVHIPRAAELGFQAQGTIGGQTFTVPVTLQWRQDGRWYEIRFGFYNPRVGTHSRRATGLVGPQGLVPTSAEIRELQDSQEIRFDYPEAKVRFGASGADAPLLAGMQDRLSALIQLGALLAGDPARYPAGTAISLPAAHEREAGTWRFAVEADEDLPALRDKTVPTVHLANIPFSSQGARIDVWLGRTLDYLPVRLRTVEANGDTVEYTLISAYAQPTPVAPAVPATGTAGSTGQ